jgi:aryl-alcohol dehydrogenase-like predicted oxidoreductase
LWTKQRAERIKNVDQSRLSSNRLPVAPEFALPDMRHYFGIRHRSLHVADAESVRAVHAALDAGITFFDTADVYGVGHSEEMLGEALKGRRGSVVLATKFGDRFDVGTKRITGSDTSPAYIRQALEASLRRLGTDYIDLYQIHDRGLPLEESDATELYRDSERSQYLSL